MSNTLVDPRHARNNVTNFNRSPRELEIFWIFSIIVANKPAHIQDAKLARMLAHRPPDDMPRQYFRQLGMKRLRNLLEKHGIGQYRRVLGAIQGSFDIDLTAATVAELDDVYGVGRKTASFFVLHTRPDQQIACLDTHVLKYLGDKGEDVPKTTPEGPRYARLEQAFLEHIKTDYPDMSPAEADFAIWLAASSNIWKTEQADAQLDSTTT